MLCGNFESRIDRHGKIIIPQKLRNDFENKVVVIAGCKDHIEIWTQEQWAREQLGLSKVLDKVIK